MNRFYIQLFALFFATFTSVGAFAQQEVLPNYLTESEESVLEHFEFSKNSFTPAPTGDIRTMAEWEEIEYLLVTWEPNFQGILRQIVAAAVEECGVIIVTQNQSAVANYLTSNGVDITNVQFLNEPWDSIWIRDYAGNTIYTDDVGERGIVDWIYNRPRPDDNVIPEAHAALVGSPIYITDTAPNDLVNTGGNFMSDGLGNAFASELILEENEAGNPYGVSAKTEAQIDQIMEDYMGIDTYIKMTALPFDVINHIDMHMKLLDEETLLVASYPTGVADGPQIEENIDYVLNNFQSPFGTPYKIKRIPSPPSPGGNYPDNGGYYRNYANAVFINKTILVPTYRPEVDGPALAQWEEMMPGYNIVGIDVDNSGENLIAQVGAIHCITHSIGVQNPLWIVHQPIPTADTDEVIAIDAMIKHATGVNAATVFYREVGQTDWQEATMSFVSGDNWSANITMPSATVDVEYYIWAEANSGKQLTRPIVAPEGYWTINIENLSINEVANSAVSNAYPNPTDGRVNFRLKSTTGPVQVTITNLLGQQLYSNEVSTGSGVVSLDLQSQWQGTLFVTFEGDFGTTTKKVVKL